MSFGAAYDRMVWVLLEIGFYRAACGWVPVRVKTRGANLTFSPTGDNLHSKQYNFKNIRVLSARTVHRAL